ncbi:MAG TPA: EthD domain-containing protein, partial [Crenalkalicoccus sp.]|nr:EthD domain-containing protein [Crenalkalicoccus sp.]
PMSDDVHKRFSLLKRHQRLTREEFSAHYRDVHGPLASGLAGFRRYTYRYVQNHVLAAPGAAGDPPFDGVTETFQMPRRDLTRGFFQTPDYAAARRDEEVLFDLSRTASVLGRERVPVDGPEAACKCMVLLATEVGPGDLPAAAVGAVRDALPRIRRWVDNALLTASAGALGGTARPFPYDRIAELWFDDAAELDRACRDPRLSALLGQRADPAPPPLVLEVQAITVFAEPRPPFLDEP